MVTFEYKCGECGRVSEIPKGQPIGNCEHCGGTLTRIFSTFGINGFAGDAKQRNAQEKQWQTERDRESAARSDSERLDRESDRELEKMYGELVTTRTPEREKHLERRSTPGTREHQEYKELTGMEGD
jgi:predicted nucleic acid-binding Zn ribbon protein